MNALQPALGGVGGALLCSVPVSMVSVHPCLCIHVQAPTSVNPHACIRIDAPRSMHCRVPATDMPSLSAEWGRRIARQLLRGAQLSKVQARLPPIVRILSLDFVVSHACVSDPVSVTSRFVQAGPALKEGE